MEMECNICGAITNIVEKEHSQPIKGTIINYTAKRRYCPNCDKIIYDKILDNDAIKKGLSLYLKKVGLEKEKIINFRKEHKLSQAMLAKIIGCAKKTLISYEQGSSIPNDTYLIVLKTLIENPSVIQYFIESNIEQYTEAEYNKIKKLNLINENEEVNEFNGYTNININKLKAIIAMLANKEINKTKLLKEIFFIDFLYYKNYASSITGFKYVKLPFGPVPDNFEQILNQLVLSKTINYDIKIYENYEAHLIKTKKNKIDLFSK